MTKPNIVILMTDDQTYESISRMPALFARARGNGVLFSNFYVCTSQCQPSRVVMLSGQYAHNNGVTDNSHSYTLVPETGLLPYLLHQNGYKTSFCGKYFNSFDVSIHGTPAGWDDWHGANPNYYGYQINDNGVVTTRGSAATDYYNTVVAQNAMAFIASATQPFFLKASFYAPHIQSLGLPTMPHPDYKDCLPASKVFPRGPNWNPANVSDKPAYVQALPALTPTQGDTIDSYWRYATESLFTINKTINQIFDALIAAGKYNNTYIFITTDHGLLNGEQRINSEKIAPYEPSIHIPLIVSGPNIATGKTCSNITSMVDIAATILELTGTSAVHAMDGISLVPYLQNPSAAPTRNYAFIEWLGFVSNTEEGSTYTPTNYRCVRSKSWKYVEYTTGEKELYNMLTDPHEVSNVAGLATNVSTVAILSALIAQGTNCSGASCCLK